MPRRGEYDDDPGYKSKCETLRRAEPNAHLERIEIRLIAMTKNHAVIARRKSSETITHARAK